MFDYLNDKIYNVLDVTFGGGYHLQREWRQIKKTKLKGTPRMFSVTIT